MILVEYQKRQRNIVNNVLRVLLGVFDTVAYGQLSDSQWRNLLKLVYPEVEKARYESARLARDFYDSEREKHGLGDHDVWLSNYSLERFYQDMEHTRKSMVKPEASNRDVTKAGMGVARAVENGGRETIIRAIEDENKQLPDRNSERLTDTVSINFNDPTVNNKFSGFEDEPAQKGGKPGGKIRGWARVATGAETCSWCLMLVSRGPVYRSAESAGAKSDSNDAMATDYFSGVDIAMKEWHPNCDCKVVPVFDDKNWEGRAAYVKAYMAWLSITEEYSGYDKVNAFRRAEYHGLLDDLEAE